jgi:D-alanyl-D-alanine endopeptidase (penicillin-binding protein 7)
MNARPQQLGMTDTRYVEPTGLSSRNQSSAHDLSLLVKAAYAHPMHPRAVDLARGGSFLWAAAGPVSQHQWPGAQPELGHRPAEDRLYLRGGPLRGDAGADGGRKLIMVLLDSAGKYSRIGDAERIRKWLGSAGAGARLLS